MFRHISIAATLAGIATTVTAHHSVSGVFDASQRVRLQGVISKIDWINPHTFIYLQVPEDDGGTTTWRLESLPTAMLRKAGLSSEMIRDGGSVVEVEAILARDGTPNFAWLLRIDYEDGHYYQLAGE